MEDIDFGMIDLTDNKENKNIKNIQNKEDNFSSMQTNDNNSDKQSLLNVNEPKIQKNENSYYDTLHESIFDTLVNFFIYFFLEKRHSFNFK